MTIDANTLLRLRRMVSEPTQTPYSDEILTDYITDHPCIDTAGLSSGDSGWLETYDLHAAAGDIWEEKAALVQMYYDFSADGGNYSQSQLYEAAMDQARYHFARRRVQARDVHKSPKEIDHGVLGLTWDPTYAWWRAN